MSVSTPMYTIRYIYTNTGVGMLCIITLYSALLWEEFSDCP